MYITRALEPVVRRYSEYFKVVVVTGPRQVGKTTMLKHLSEQDAQAGVERSYVTLDNTALRMAARNDPELFLQRYRPPVLIDEIQKAPELLPYIKLAADAAEENGTYWLTGSQPLHLMKEVSETLAGRVGVIEMAGLSNAELAGGQSRPFSPGEEYFVSRVAEAPPFGVEEAFARICAGGFPGIRALPEDLRPAAYESYLEAYIMRDIRDLAQVVDELKFRRFMTACAALTARPVVYAELARLADIDEKTAKAWLSLLASTYLVKIVPPYSNNLLKRLGKQPIMHFNDTGLAAYLAGWSDSRTLELGAMSGQMFESWVFGEIYKSHTNAGAAPKLFFFRTNDKREIDLLLEKDGVLFPVEVKKTARPVRADTRHFKALAPVSCEDVPATQAMLRREVGVGSLVCMTSDTFPVGEGAWAFPAWAI